MYRNYYFVITVEEEERATPLFKGFDGTYYTWEGFMGSDWGWRRRFVFNLVFAAHLALLAAGIWMVVWIIQKIGNYLASL